MDGLLILLLEDELCPPNLDLFLLPHWGREECRLHADRATLTAERGRVPKPVLPSHQLTGREGVIVSSEGRTEATLITAAERVTFPHCRLVKCWVREKVIPPTQPYARSRAVSQSWKTRQSVWNWVHEQLPCEGHIHPFFACHKQQLHLHASLATLCYFCKGSNYDSDLSHAFSPIFKFPEEDG